MKPVNSKRFKALSIVHLSWTGIFMLLSLVSLAYGTASFRQNDLFAFGMIFLVLVIHIGNSLYNLRLIKAVMDKDNSASFNRTASLILLILHILAVVADILTIASVWLYSPTEHNDLNNALFIFYYCFTCYIVILVALSIGSIVSQIIWLRLLKKKQRSNSEQVLDSIGHFAEDM